MQDIWCHIHSLLPMRDVARAACLSRAFLRSWRCHPKLILGWATLCSKGRGGNLCTIIDNILRNHSGGLKTLDLNLYGNECNAAFPYINSWLQIAVTPGIEKLTISLRKRNYFPCSVLSDGVRNSIRYLLLCSCTFRPTAELGPLRSLTNLFLYSVRITGDELECLLSNSPSLVELDLDDCKEISCLKIPCTLQHLNCLTVASPPCRQVIENKAPNLSSLEFGGGVIIGETKQIKSLRLDRSGSEDGVYYALDELPSIMPNLETLDISSGYEALNTPMLPTLKFLYLKHLTIRIFGVSIYSYDCFSLVSFLDASPSLQKLYLNVSHVGSEHVSASKGSSHLRQLPEHCCNDHLKNVEIIPFSSAKSLVELTRCIVKSAVSLKHLKLHTLRINKRCSGDSSSNCPDKHCWPLSISNAVLDGAARAATAIRDYIEDVVPATAELTVLGPCKRCHSIPVDG
ncbi:unnamed protein product [Urochloa decumbens]|uniref:At1g61320/AtMIF1 LRR domain-containing protein n=1 Tax=Urochloa decumbens TaxID=240449 RepID=A0ABC9BXW0_9POAL